MTYAPNGVNLRVMCSSRIDPQHILYAFRAGADANIMLRKNYEAQVKKGKLKEDKYAQRMALLKTTLSYDDLKDCDLIIEAVVENRDAKIEVFRKLDSICPPATVFADGSLLLMLVPADFDNDGVVDLAVLCGLLAFACHAHDALSFGRGVGTEDEPALWQKDLTGAIDLWIEVGQPDEKRLRKACNRATRQQKNLLQFAQADFPNVMMRGAEVYLIATIAQPLEKGTRVEYYRLAEGVATRVDKLPPTKPEPTRNSGSRCKPVRNSNFRERISTSSL